MTHYDTDDNNDKDASVDGNGSNTHDLNSNPSGDGVQGADDDDKGKKAAPDTLEDANDDDDDEKKDSTNSITKQFTQVRFY